MFFLIFRATQDKPSHMLDLLDTDLTSTNNVDPWSVPQPPRPKVKFILSKIDFETVQFL